jgi:DNA-binding GntR family transcriptional regulator
MTKRDRIVAALRQMIQDGELPRGSRIQQDVLAEMFQTSITPVREALVLLESEGLLVGEPNRGVSVADADFEAVKAVYVQRMLFEPYAMKRAARRISQIDLDKADSLLIRIHSSKSENEVVSVPELNRQFHFLFYNSCGNAALKTQIEQLWQRWPWDLLRVIKKRPSASHKEHVEIMHAVRAGDIEAVGIATENHLRQSFLSLGMHLTDRPQPDIFDLDMD